MALPSVSHKPTRHLGDRQLGRVLTTLTRLEWVRLQQLVNTMLEKTSGRMEGKKVELPDVFF